MHKDGYCMYKSCMFTGYMFQNYLLSIYFCLFQLTALICPQFSLTRLSNWAMDHLLLLMYYANLDKSSHRHRFLCEIFYSVCDSEILNLLWNDSFRLSTYSATKPALWRRTSWASISVPSTDTLMVSATHTHTHKRSYLSRGTTAVCYY